MARKSNKKFDDHDRMLMLWCLSERNNAKDAYRKANRDYCLGKATWEQVTECMKKAKHHGISDDELIEVDIEVQNSLTDEEILEAVG